MNQETKDFYMFIAMIMNFGMFLTVLYFKTPISQSIMIYPVILFILSFFFAMLGSDLFIFRRDEDNIMEVKSNE